jgi:hypothetical protein
MSNKSGPQPYNRRLLKPNILGYAPFGEQAGVTGSEAMPDDALYLRAVTPTVPKGGARKKKVIRKKKKSLVKKKKSVTKKKKSVVKRKKSVVKRKKSVTKKKKSATKKKKPKRKKSTRR